MHFLILIIGAVIFCVAPVWLQVVISLINSVLPDPIPWVDELLMWAVVVGRLMKRPPQVRLRSRAR